MTLPYNTYFEQPYKLKFENPTAKGHRGKRWPWGMYGKIDYTRAAVMMAIL
jgi:hypothetical protein